jgi:hypothetical protein
MRRSEVRPFPGEPILFSCSSVVERSLDKREVAGSMPAAGTSFLYSSRCSAAGSASGLGPEGRGFEPCHRDQSIHGACGAAVSASGCDPEGRGFDSHQTPQHLPPVAESADAPASKAGAHPACPFDSDRGDQFNASGSSGVEHRPHKAARGGSSPPRTTIFQAGLAHSARAPGF